jgi:hypothetical protein
LEAPLKDTRGVEVNGIQKFIHDIVLLLLWTNIVPVKRVLFVFPK